MTISFKGAPFPKDVILHAVFFYQRYSVSYRDLEEILAERGVEVDHAAQNRWIVKYSPLVANKARRQKRCWDRSWRMDATYEVHDTTIGWRFVNPLLKAQYGVVSMPETAENVAVHFGVTREDQDAFALRSEQKAGSAMKNGRLAREITSVILPQLKGDPKVVEGDEHPRPYTTPESLAKLKAFVRAEGTITAGNASGVNDGRRRWYLPPRMPPGLVT